MPVQFEQKSFTVGSNDGSAAENYRTNFDRIFGKKSPEKKAEDQGQDHHEQDGRGDQTVHEQVDQ